MNAYSSLRRIALLAVGLFSIAQVVQTAHAQPNLSQCGDGVVDEDLGEVCDDGNDINFDFCSNTCTLGIDIEMVTIPSGVFFMGSNTSYKDEAPRHKVTIENNFLFSKTEITHAQYRACVDANACSSPGTRNGCIWGSEDTDNLPINCVNWKQAQQFATFAGARLPTEAEWEYVASSLDDRLYPWGNEQPTCEFAVLSSCSETPQPVCSSEDVPRDDVLGRQLFPICDLAGNISEWVQDNYSTNYATNPIDGSAFSTTHRILKNYRVLRGGAWFTPLYHLKVTDRFSRIFLYQTPDLGIRLAKTSLCGNTVINDDEDCDDGNLIDGDGCDSNCTFTGCNNGILNQDFDQDGIPDLGDPRFEFCDLRPVEGRACLNNCTIDTCGDEIIQDQFGEECDNGADNSDILVDSCRTTCRFAFCGDSVTDTDEECDDGLNNNDASPDACRTDCKVAHCGDGVQDQGEECDLGVGNSDTDPNTCRTNCRLPSCGDDVQDDTEECDDGDDNDDTVVNACRESCLVAHCTDGVIDDNEICDDGDQDDTNACLNTCQAASCGDGFKRLDLAPNEVGYEPCDDGNVNQNDDCLIGCIPASCGDGFVQTNVEICDDGNDQEGDGCDSGCQVEQDFSCTADEPSVCFPDVDQDDVADDIDNCPDEANTDQIDIDEDDIGDECDPSFDLDSDGVFDGRDNCPNASNQFQEDFDSNGLGDACDDFDNDGDVDANDNCVEVANSNQLNSDDDLEGDACDLNDDNDGLTDLEEDLNNNGQVDPGETDPTLADTDNDTIDDHLDNCPVTSNQDQQNTDVTLSQQQDSLVLGDGLGDACDPDDDNDLLDDEDEDLNQDNIVDALESDPFDPDSDSDGVIDGLDNCPLTSSVDQTDTDNDGEGNACDLDDDNDGLSDIDESEQNTDSLVPDTDTDGIGDLEDNCPLDSNFNQQNTDLELSLAPNPVVAGDSQGDICDDDDDNDGLLDLEEDLNSTGAIEAGETDPLNPDTDGDGDLDGADNCRLDSNSDQTDFDGDLAGDACDPNDDNDGLDDVDEDLDGDGILDPGETDPFDRDTDDDLREDHVDNCPRVPNNNQLNTDESFNISDALGDACDNDDDNDGLDDDQEDVNSNSIVDAGETDPLIPDSDGDGVIDGSDNCPLTSSVDQTNTDQDSEGDACDDDDDNDGVSDVDESVNQTDPLVADTDSDGVSDLTDNCPLIQNLNQENTDKSLAALPNTLIVGDELGNVCDPDDDNDGLADQQEDVNDTGAIEAGETNPLNPDTDGDGRLDGADNCRLDSNNDQADFDQDLAGDACDPDDDNDGLDDTQEDLDGDGFLDPDETSPFNADTDGDGVTDNLDNCGRVPNPDQINTDQNFNISDALGDACDLDDDNDGLNDLQEDVNNDGIKDPLETNPFNPDSDADGVLDGADNCPLTSSVDQTDTDNDGEGDSCDTDDDNDGLSDIDEAQQNTDPLNADSDSDNINDNQDNCPLIANNDQLNTDQLPDGGNACDPDDDEDGLTDAQEDINNDGILDPNETNPLLVDSDGDGVSDLTDNCKRLINLNQLNSDNDALGDACDEDDDNDGLTDAQEDLDGDGFIDPNETDPKLEDTDGDGVRDNIDNCPRVQNANQLNTDFNLGNVPSDNEGDACDNDDDNDGLFDVQEDTDNDGILDDDETSRVNPDSDGDGFLDGADNCPRTASVDQTNSDNDPEGDACDDDDDNDGISDIDEFDQFTDPQDPDTDNDGRGDAIDNCPTIPNPDQRNSDLANDGGDACDFDDDNDGLTDLQENPNNDEFVDEGESNPRLADTDGDGDLDPVDNCPQDFNPNQLNTDGANDGGDACDLDDDDDTIPDTAEDINNNNFVDFNETDPKKADTDDDTIRDNVDNCPLAQNPNQRNTDQGPGGDTLGDACDDDDDNDGLNDNEEDLDNDGVIDQGETNPENPDTDGDGFIDGQDNCPLVASVDQTNSDGLNDGGDACDTDDDEDGLTDIEEIIIGIDPLDPDTDNDGDLDGNDNCPSIPNGDQVNTDQILSQQPNALIAGDTLGDACDTDDDNDGTLDVNEVAQGTLSTDPDTDNDGRLDGVDNCPVNSNSDQNNSDNLDDGGDACDDDDDEDGVLDENEAALGTLPQNPDFDDDGRLDGFDNCPTVSNSTQVNTDGLNDGGDACDLDDDNDGLSDITEGNLNTNPLEPDSDGDGVQDGQDNCPLTSSVDQTNTDGLNDGGDACDTDDDEDGVTDIEEVTLGTDPQNPDTDGDNNFDGVDNCPTVPNPDQANVDFAPDGGDACDIDDDNDTLSDATEIQLGTNPSKADTDDDGHNDNIDNCPLVFNQNQANSDGRNDGGDACDDDDDEDGLTDAQEVEAGTLRTNPDSDGDTFKDGFDNCPAVNNADQQNSDGENDGGDACDDDDDNDGLLDTEEPPLGTSRTNPDTDDDGFLDGFDNCPLFPSVDQQNTDGSNDGGDVCDDDDDDDGLTDIEELGLGTDPLDSDTDNDLINDFTDNCPLIQNDNQANSDQANDGGDACDLDDDNDGLLDTDELNLGTDPTLADTDNDQTSDFNDNCPLTPNQDQDDFDFDGFGNGCDDDDDDDGLTDIEEDLNGNGVFDEGIEPNPLDEDTDNDSVLDGDDNCPTVSNVNQENTDADPKGDACDNDNDNDGLTDDEEGILGTNPNKADTDDDGLNDPVDNCPLFSSVDTTDTDGDGEGNPCDLDDDNDGLSDFDEAQVGSNPLSQDSDGDLILDPDDNCPIDLNNDQTNTDDDDFGDVCDTDDDGDGFQDTDEEICNSDPLDSNSLPPDQDNDNVCDTNDICFGDDSSGDTDVDGECDNLDLDDDQDGFTDAREIICQSDPKVAQDIPIDTDLDGFCDPEDQCDGDDNEGDTDGDGACNDVDTNDDGDAFSDVDETTCGSNPLLANSEPLDTDGDGLCDAGIDPDDDNDTIADVDEQITDPLKRDTDDDGHDDNVDNCPATFNADQLNTDAQNDGGDVCDDDDDNDTIDDNDDLDPLDNEVCIDTDDDSCDDCASGTFNPAIDGLDTNGDGQCDAGDDDNDGDNFSDTLEEACGSDPQSVNSVPSDGDEDGVCDTLDNCLTVKNLDQSDVDGNQIGDACDCGDGLQADNEECDSQNQDTAFCNFNCTIPVCGDGLFNQEAGEECDDGNQINTDGCPDDIADSGSCQLAVCGDGFQQNFVEICDDGNTISGDGCDANCTFTACGNGIPTGDEECDDGDTTNGDGCDNNCKTTRCGNGILTENEECDDGNLANGDGCDDQCTFEAPCFEVDACPNLTFISINAGSYSMGNNAISNASPEHQVTLSAFVVTRSEVTVGEYRNCVDSGACSPPQFTQTSETEKSNYQLGEENPNRPFKDEYPMNRIAWNEAVTFAEWVGGRLPTEAEWEYFATSEGTDNLYAWGDDVPDCTLAIKKENDINGCGTNGSRPVCSLSPAGDTAQGLCDVTGNLVEWTADERSSDYQAADPNGSAFIVPDPNNDPSGDRFYRMTRGGAYGSPLPVQLESRRRFSDSYFRKSPFNGFRVVKEPVD